MYEWILLISYALYAQSYVFVTHVYTLWPQELTVFYAQILSSYYDRATH